MRDSIRLRFSASGLPIILIAAVVQGWALYGLHRAIVASSWPATNLGWLAALYALVLFSPLTIQVLHEHIKSKALWLIVGAMSAAFVYFGWHYGNVVHDASYKFVDSEASGSTAFVIGLLWLLILPFIQVRLSTGTWAVEYPQVFTTAWRNKLLLAEAAAFTALFWLLLGLTAQLFGMLGISFFKELFSAPLFIYPVTTLTFGIALHLIGSVERLTAVVLEQILNVLKWLAIVAGLILALFTVALLFKLPGLIVGGERVLSAAWLLGLVAVIVLLMNAAYRDGRVERPYPQWIALALRCVIPFTIVVSLTALYALIVRANQYGLTVERVWGLLVAGTALLYAVGYSIAAVRPGQWFGWLGRANIVVALVLIATITATLTPILSPYRLAANSQYRVSLTASPVRPSASFRQSSRESALRYLRFNSGSYGIGKLTLLTDLKDHPAADSLRKESIAVLKLKNQGEMIPIETDALLANIVISPPGKEIDAALRAAIIAAHSAERLNRLLQPQATAGLFVDLRGDKTDEFVLLSPQGGDVYELMDGKWAVTGRTAIFQAGKRDAASILKDVKAGRVTTEVSEWKYLKVGPLRYQVVQPASQAP